MTIDLALAINKKLGLSSLNDKGESLIKDYANITHVTSLFQGNERAIKDFIQFEPFTGNEKTLRGQLVEAIARITMTRDIPHYERLKRFVCLYMTSVEWEDSIFVYSVPTERAKHNWDLFCEQLALELKADDYMEMDTTEREVHFVRHYGEFFTTDAEFPTIRKDLVKFADYTARGVIHFHLVMGKLGLQPSNIERVETQGAFFSEFKPVKGYKLKLKGRTDFVLHTTTGRTILLELKTFNDSCPSTWEKYALGNADFYNSGSKANYLLQLSLYAAAAQYDEVMIVGTSCKSKAIFSDEFLSFEEAGGSKDGVFSLSVLSQPAGKTSSTRIAYAVRLNDIEKCRPKIDRAVKSYAETLIKVLEELNDLSEWENWGSLSTQEKKYALCQRMQLLKSEDLLEDFT